MSCRTSFCTEFIFNKDDYKKLRELLENKGFDITEPLEDPFFGWEINVISGFASTFNDYFEVDLIEALSDFKPKEQIKIILIKEGGVIEVVLNTELDKPIEVYKLVRGEY